MRSTNGSVRRCVPECFEIEFERRGQATQAAVCMMDSNGRALLNKPATCATAVRCLQCVESAHSSITSVSFGIVSADLNITTRFLHIGTNVKFDHTWNSSHVYGQSTRKINWPCAVEVTVEVCQHFVIKVGQDKNFNHWGFTYSSNTSHEGGENSGIFTSVDASADIQITHFHRMLWRIQRVPLERKTMNTQSWVTERYLPFSYSTHQFLFFITQS